MTALRVRSYASLSETNVAEYLLGIDHGGTLSKVVLFDLHGREVQCAGAKTQASYPFPGWAERDSETLWQTTATTIRSLIEAAAIKPGEICAIGVTGHGN